jgi:hypothetical protein
MSKILELAKRIASTGGLETKTTETISGTYDSAGQQRLLSHAYTIGGNLTITNGELILSRLANNGTDMTLEFGSDVTLTGDGMLMLGELGVGQQNQDFSASRITGKLPSTIFPAGHVLQVKSTVVTDYFLITGTTPGDDTIPQSNEGGEVITQAITASATNNTFLIFVNVFGGTSANDTATLALFKNSDANAIAATGILDTGSKNRSLVHKITTGSTSEITFKVRIGCTWASFYVNSNTTNRVYGGVASTTLTIYEVKG